jgi:membrane fusion protein (multidrug efflux system)
MIEFQSCDRMMRSLLVLACGVLAFGCGSEDPTPAAADGLRPPVMVVLSERRDVVDRIRATGQLIAQAEATIAAQVAGQVTEIRVREGEGVETDAVLLVIDPERRQLEVDNAEAQLAEARAELAVSKRSYERTKRLSRGNVASEARLDEDRTRESLARSAEAGALARLGLTRRALEDATVRAPFSGLIARRHVSVGEYLTTGSALFDLVALDPIEIEFTLAEIDSSKVEIGHPVKIALAPYPDESFGATVTMISPTIDPRTRTLRVKAELPNPDGRIRPGLFAHVDLGVSERHGVIVVPEDAIVQRASGTVIYRVDAEARAERVNVETGVRLEGWIEISESVGAGDRIVVRGQNRLDDGIMVSVRSSQGALVPPAVVAPEPEPEPEDLASEATP